MQAERLPPDLSPDSGHIRTESSWSENSWPKQLDRRNPLSEKGSSRVQPDSLTCSSTGISEGTVCMRQVFLTSSQSLSENSFFEGMTCKKGLPRVREESLYAFCPSSFQTRKTRVSIM